MKHSFLGCAIGFMLLLSTTFSFGQGRGKAGEKPAAGRPGAGGPGAGAGRPGAGGPGAAGRPDGNKPGAGKPPGGNWSEAKQPQGNNLKEAGALGARNSSSQSSGEKGVAAGAAASNRNAPKDTGAEGAAAGAAAANRNAPKSTGAEGAAAGAAAVNRNAPKATGAEGAAAGAAAANRNAPKATGAEGAAAGAAVAGRNSPQVSGAAGYAAVKDSFDRHDLYGEDWHGAHPGAWTATGWAAGTEWTPTAWNTVASHCNYGKVAPVSYNYGTNVTCVSGNILLDGQSIGTAEEFSQQAADLAQAGIDAEVSDTSKWLPLGVFAMVRNEDQHPQLILQLAVNEQGVLRGNYTDEATDNTLPIRGQVDPKTQRAAWIVGDKTASIMEAGMTNLTQGEAPALIHKNGKTDRWMLVRLPQPK